MRNNLFRFHNLPTFQVKRKKNIFHEVRNVSRNVIWGPSIWAGLETWVKNSAARRFALNLLGYCEFQMHSDLLRLKKLNCTPNLKRVSSENSDANSEMLLQLGFSQNWISNCISFHFCRRKNDSFEFFQQKIKTISEAEWDLIKKILRNIGISQIGKNIGSQRWILLFQTTKENRIFFLGFLYEQSVINSSIYLF